MARVLALMAKEFHAVWRDKRSRAVLIGPPLVQLFVFSYAATFEVDHVAMAVYNEDDGAEGRELISRFTDSPGFRLAATITRNADISRVVDSGAAALVLHVGRNFSTELRAGRTARLQAIVDGRRSNNALVILGYAGAIVRDFNIEWAQAHGRAPPPARLVMRAWFNPNLSSQWFIVPGLVVLLTMLITTLVTALTIARERELGTFEQLLVTPLRPVEILIGKVTPALVLGLGEGTVIAGFAVAWFKIPLQGNIFFLYAGLSVFLLSVVGVGVMVSSFAKTQQQAIFGAFMFFITATLLSGFATPIESMADWVQVITYANPMRYCLIITRGIFLQGLSWDLVARQLLPMALIGLAALSVATVLFRRRLY